jgi:hypothetical protein
VVKGCGPRRRGLKEHAVVVSFYLSEEHLDESADGATNWWRLLEMVAIIVVIDLL